MEITTEHIIAYIEGRLSAKDRKELECRMEASAELRKEVEDIQFILTTTQELELQKKINSSKNWTQLSWRIKKDKARKQIRNFIRISAAVLFIPLLVTTYFLFNRMNRWQDLQVEQVEMTSAYGLVSKVILPDGSEAWLNSGSTIVYPKIFSGWRRTVRLSGEAYFNVASNRLNRFDVIVPNGMIVSAYGTEFNINAYEDDQQIEATLVKGNVEVSKDAEAVTSVLSPGEQAVYNKETGDLKVEQANIQVKTAWKDGKMIFRRANMAEIAKRLSRRFNADIRLEGKELYDYEYSATFTNETLDEIIFLLGKTAPIKCEIIEPELTDDLSFSKRMVIIRKK